MCQGSIPIGPDLTSLQNLPNPTGLSEPDLTFFVINLTTYFLENVDALAYMYGGWGGVPAYPYWASQTLQSLEGAVPNFIEVTKIYQDFLALKS